MAKKPPAWNTTLTDLLSLLVTMFVTIYALTDHQHAPESKATNAESRIYSKTTDNSVQIEDIDTSFADYITANIYSKLQDPEIKVLQRAHSIIIEIPSNKILREQDGQIHAQGKFLLSSITQSWKANPPSEAEISFESSSDNKISLQEACIMADFMLNFAEALDTVKCSTTSSAVAKISKVKITLLE